MQFVHDNGLPYAILNMVDANAMGRQVRGTFIVLIDHVAIVFHEYYFYVFLSVVFLNVADQLFACRVANVRAGYRELYVLHNARVTDDLYLAHLHRVRPLERFT